jgi:hypothetical protein
MATWISESGLLNSQMLRPTTKPTSLGLAPDDPSEFRNSGLNVLPSFDNVRDCPKCVYCSWPGQYRGRNDALTVTGMSQWACIGLVLTVGWCKRQAKKRPAEASKSQSHHGPDLQAFCHMSTTSHLLATRRSWCSLDLSLGSGLSRTCVHPASNTSFLRWLWVLG